MAMIMASLKLNDRLPGVENTFITSSVIKFNKFKKEKVVTQWHQRLFLIKFSTSKHLNIYFL